MSQTTAPATARTVPLCVDLDESLVRTDVMIESLIKLARRNPLLLVAAAFWLTRGRAYFKERIAARLAIDPAALPYHDDVLEYLRAEKARGRTLILATAAHHSVAQAVSKHLGIFDDAMGTTPDVNLTGSKKARALVERFGERGFDYVGDRAVDLKVWRHAAGAVMVQPSASLVARAGEVTQVVHVFPREKNRLFALVKGMRPYQWVKNVLLFAPFMLAHHVRDWDLLGINVVAFAAFSLCASSVYIINDLIDLDADRHHPVKRRRPFAAGHVPILWAAAMIPALLIVAGVTATFVNDAFVGLLAAYFILTLAYSVRIKQVPGADVIFLAGLYTLRIYAGSRATDIRISQWLLTFSIFFFLCLALVKRLSELVMMQRANKTGAAGRGYRVEDLAQVSSLASSTGCLSVLVLALYTSSPEVTALYARPRMLWLLCPIFLYWITRILLKANRGHVHSDPIVYALKDRASYLVALLVVIVALMARPF